MRPTPGHHAETIHDGEPCHPECASTTSQCEAGDGTVEHDGAILATIVGTTIQDGVGTVANQEICTPEIGDTVIVVLKNSMKRMVKQ